MRSKFINVVTGAVAVMLVGSLAVVAGCAGGYSTKLTEPEEGKILIIGSCLIENVRGSSHLRNAYTEGMEISIMGDVEEEGVMVRKDVTIWAYDDGYYCVENLPMGKYTLKGVRITGNPGIECTIWNELRMPNERWMVAGASHRYSFTGEYFHFSQRLNVFNFQHSVFSVMGSGQVYWETRPKMDNEIFHLETGYTRDYVEKYFIDKFPDSGWTPTLQILLPVGGDNR